MKLRLFGAFKEMGSELELDLSGQDSVTVSELRKLLAAKLGGAHAALVAQSAFGNQSKILGDGDLVRGTDELAILPPVCGG